MKTYSHILLDRSQIPGLPVVFLDIDGVVATDVSYAYAMALPRAPGAVPRPSADFLCADATRRLDGLCVATGAVVVVISSWLDDYARPDGDPWRPEWEPLRRSAQVECAVRVAGFLREKGLTVPVVAAIDRSPTGRRFSEYGDVRAGAIVAYLDARPSVRRYVVLDDTVDHYGKGRRKGGVLERVRYNDPRFAMRCVHPVETVGLTDEDCAQAERILMRCDTDEEPQP